MTLDYYYGDQAEQFSFYRIPKVLFTDKRFKDISAEAKILYGLLLDRMSLSAKNGWLDQEGRVYIVYTVEDIMDALSCASQKAMKLLNELDEKCGLIERKRQGLGKPNLIYVKNFVSAPESKFKNGENQNSGLLKIETQEFPKSKGSNTEKNNTKQEKTTDIWFDEKDPLIHIRTHNTDLKKRLAAYAGQHPDQCRQTDADPETGCMEFVIRKGRFSFRLTAPYSEERRNAASKAAKKHSGNLTHPIQKDVL